MKWANPHSGTPMGWRCIVPDCRLNHRVDPRSPVVTGQPNPQEALGAKGVDPRSLMGRGDAVAVRSYMSLSQGLIPVP